MTGEFQGRSATFDLRKGPICDCGAENDGHRWSIGTDGRQFVEFDSDVNIEDGDEVLIVFYTVRCARGENELFPPQSGWTCTNEGCPGCSASQLKVKLI
jgi:hypothetical protein